MTSPDPAPSPDEVSESGSKPGPPKEFIEVRGLRKSLGGQAIHEGVDLEVHTGETLVILGASGEGKSVLLKQILGLMAPDAGSIRIEGVDIAGLPERKLGEVRRKIGILFQNGALFDSLSVAENVAFPLRQNGVKDRQRIAERVHHCLDVVELAEHKEKMPVDLSGGMRKRVALARAMSGGPRCILYDEPTAGLDPIVSDSINRLIRRLQRRFGMTSVVVTHDMKSAFHIADRIVYLRKGKVYFTGSPEELRASKDTRIQDFVDGRSRDPSPPPTTIPQAQAQADHQP